MVKVNGLQLAVFNVDGSFFAIDNQCPHSRGPLSEGRVFNKRVTCPWHGSKFDLKTGSCLAGPATTDVESYPVIIKEEAVFVEIA